MSYYVIRSRLGTGFVLDCKGNEGDGAEVIPWERHGNDNQIWYDDNASGTIRSKAGGLCLTVDGDTLRVKRYAPGDPNQQWMRQGETIRNRVEQEKVIDIFGENTEPGAKVGAYKYNGGKNQQWEFDMVGGYAEGVGYAGGQRREFHIASEMNGKVLDVAEGKMEPGAKIVMWDKHQPAEKNQLWYLDNTGLLRSALNDLTFSNCEKGKDLRTAMPGPDPRTQWMFEGNVIRSRTGEVMDISGCNEDNGAEICSYDFHGESNQHWRMEWV